MPITDRRYPAGHGPVIDLAKDPKNAELVSEVRAPSMQRYLLATSDDRTSCSSGRVVR